MSVRPCLHRAALRLRCAHTCDAPPKRNLVTCFQQALGRRHCTPLHTLPPLSQLQPPGYRQHSPPATPLVLSYWATTTHVSMRRIRSGNSIPRSASPWAAGPTSSRASVAANARLPTARHAAVAVTRSARHTVGSRSGSLPCLAALPSLVRALRSTCTGQAGVKVDP